MLVALRFRLATSKKKPGHTPGETERQMSAFLAITAVGYIGNDAELAMTSNGTKVVHFDIATQDYQGKTNWNRVSYFGDRGEKLLPSLTKGRMVAVQGTPTPARAFKKRDDTMGAAWDIVARDIQLLGPGKKTEQTTETPVEGEPVVDF